MGRVACDEVVLSYELLLEELPKGKRRALELGSPVERDNWTLLLCVFQLPSARLASAFSPGATMQLLAGQYGC